MRTVMMVLVLCTATARAEDTKAAERYFRAGEKAYKAQNFAAAAQNFEEAYRAAAIPEIAFSAAQAYRRQFRVDPRPEYVKRSVELYTEYLDKVKTGGRVGDAADSLGEMKRELDKLGGMSMVKLAPVVARTALGINALLENESQGGAMREIADLPDAATVKVIATIDGKPVPAYEMIDLEPGPHAIHVEAEGYLPVDRTDRAFKGAAVFVDVKLLPKPAQITVQTDPGARIRVDGRPVGMAPATFEVPAGRHVVAISRDGREPIAREIIVTRGQKLTVRESLVKTVRRRSVPWAFAASGGLLILTGVVGVYATVQDARAADKFDAITQRGDAQDDDRRAYDEQLERRDDAITGTWILGGLTVGVAAIATALYVFDSPSDDRVRVTPMMSAGGGGGAQVIGRF
ncbi:MAG: PEGA domain-containing protein [Deltaproteobacteria bacterium]|nr:PEGA domain-containing protein [Deltaproteobacteria bacterium]